LALALALRHARHLFTIPHRRRNVLCCRNGRLLRDATTETLIIAFLFQISGIIVIAGTTRNAAHRGQISRTVILIVRIGKAAAERCGTVTFVVRVVET